MADSNLTVGFGPQARPLTCPLATYERGYVQLVFERAESRHIAISLGLIGDRDSPIVRIIECRSFVRGAFERKARWSFGC